MQLKSTRVLLANGLATDGCPPATKDITEGLLLNCLQTQDKRALSLLYDAYSPALYGVILRIVKSNLVAEDVLQVCFLKIWTNFHSYDSTRGRLFTWLINIARHAAIDKLRSRSYLKELKTHSLAIVS